MAIILRNVMAFYHKARYSSPPEAETPTADPPAHESEGTAASCPPLPAEPLSAKPGFRIATDRGPSRYGEAHEAAVDLESTGGKLVRSIDSPAFREVTLTLIGILSRCARASLLEALTGADTAGLRAAVESGELTLGLVATRSDAAPGGLSALQWAEMVLEAGDCLAGDLQLDGPSFVRALSDWKFAKAKDSHSEFWGSLSALLGSLLGVPLRSSRPCCFKRASSISRFILP